MSGLARPSDYSRLNYIPLGKKDFEFYVLIEGY